MAAVPPPAVQHPFHRTTPMKPTTLKPELEEVKYWNNNLPSHLWTEECPVFLLGLSAKNIGILSSREEEYQYLTWNDCKVLVRTNNIDAFQRSPLTIRRYIKYMSELREKYGSVMSFLQNERLHWYSTEATSRVPFANPSDYRILHNDWPYGVEPNIVHLVIWVKFELPDDPVTGYITTEAAKQVDRFVHRTFCSDCGAVDGVPSSELLWFKNWNNLKSVKALEHFHVMLNNPSKEFLNRITRGDIAMADVVVGEGIS